MQRRIDLDGCHNFRDLGGYPAGGGRRIRWRKLYRSDALHHLTPAGLDQLRSELGVGVVIDLRSSAEVRVDGVGALEEAGLRVHHLPLFDGEVAGASALPPDATLADRYFLLAEYASKPIARVLEVLAEATTPAVYHCAAGKDRTGVISAILLGLLEVDDALIALDYAATRENLDAIVERLMASEGYEEMLAQLPPDSLHAEPETMMGLLERIRDHYGSVRDYAGRIGVSATTLGRLRERLLED